MKSIKRIIIGILFVVMFGLTSCGGMGGVNFAYHRNCDMGAAGFHLGVERVLWERWGVEIEAGMVVLDGLGWKRNVEVIDIGLKEYLEMGYWSKLVLKNANYILIFSHQNDLARNNQLGYSANYLSENYIGIDMKRSSHLGSMSIRNLFIHEILHAMGANHEEHIRSYLNKSVASWGDCFGEELLIGLRRRWCFVGSGVKKCN